LAAYNPGWDQNLGGNAVGASAWIGPNANANEYKTLPGRYVFQTTFTLPGTYANPVLNDTLLSDNAVAVYLNGFLVEQQVIADCPDLSTTCNWNSTAKFVISDNNPAHFVAGTNYITVLLVDTPNGGTPGNSYACTKLPQKNGSHLFTQDNAVPTVPDHVYAGFDPATYATTGGCQNPTGLDFSGNVAYTVPATLQWCSPGFWKNHLNAWSLADQNKLYSSLGAGRAPLSKKAPTSGPGSNPTLKDVVSDPSTYGGPATNSVADYLSGVAFGTNVGTSADDSRCNDGIPLVQANF